MWMIDPTPETTRSISLLKSSRIKASGTVKTPRMSIQVNSGAETSILPKIEQLHRKLPRTAATDIKPLMFCQRRVNKVMTPAEVSGRSKTNHGSKLLVVKVKILKYWFARESREWTRMLRRRHRRDHLSSS